jgi:4-amino-4-deoxy-L-arabinose transferase-like glycosyltransferase
VTFFFIYRKNGIKIKINRIIFDKYSLYLSGIFIIAFFLYFFFPTSYLLGGRDPGLYSAFGTHIAKTGTLDLYDSVLSEIYPYLKGSIKLEYPGIYSGLVRHLTDSPSILIPQFLHLFTSLLALGYELFGLSGLLRVNAFIGILSLGVIYIYVNKITNKRTAILAVSFMLVNPAQLWNVRITLTETLAQFLLILSLYLLVIAIKNKNMTFYIISGIILGIGNLNRIDSHINMIGVVVFAAYYIITNKNIRNVIAFGSSYVIVAACSLCYAYYYSYPYIFDLWVSGTLKGLLYVNLLCLIFVVLLMLIYVIILKRHLKFKHFKSVFKFIKANGGTIVAVFCVFLTVIGLFIRPHLFSYNIEPNSSSFFNANALEQFLFYIPITNLLFGIWGLAYILRSKKTLFYIAFITIGMASVIGYIYRPSITPDHIWASRRWVSVSFPVIAILSASGIVGISNKIKRSNLRFVFISIFTIFTISFSLHQASPYLFKAMLKDYDKGYKELARVIPNDSITFIDDDDGWLASPLKYIYDRNTYLVANYEKQFTEGLKNIINYNNFDKQIYFVNRIPQVDNNENISFDQITIANISGYYLEKTKGEFPRSLYKRDFQLPIYKATFSEDRVSYSWLPVTIFNTVIGEKTDRNTYVSSGKQGFLMFGPYIRLKKGQYNVSVKSKLVQSKGNSELGFVDIVFDKGKNQIERVDITEENVKNGVLDSNITFSLDSPIENMEIRVFVNNDVVIEINKVTLERLK